MIFNDYFLALDFIFTLWKLFIQVSEGELEWLQKDVENLIASEESSGMLTFLVKTHDELAEARQAMGAAKKVIRFILYKYRFFFQIFKCY